MPDTEFKNDLERSMAAADTDVESRRDFLRILVKSRVIVLLDEPWDGRSLPHTGAHLMLVSDGPNKKQTMLAIFTAQDKTEEFLNAETPYKHAVEVDAAWAMLGIPADAGAMINPNSPLSFRIAPDVASILRDTVQKALKLRMNMPQGAAGK